MKTFAETESFLKELAQFIDRVLTENFGREKVGFCLLTFNFNKPGVANYTSNATRESMIASLRETACRLENNEDFPPTFGLMQ